MDVVQVFGNQAAQNEGKLTGTAADLRRLKVPALKDKLRGLGVEDSQFKDMKRWELVDLLRRAAAPGLTSTFVPLTSVCMCLQGCIHSLMRTACQLFAFTLDELRLPCTRWRFSCAALHRFCARLRSLATKCCNSPPTSWCCDAGMLITVSCKCCAALKVQGVFRAGCPALTSFKFVDG